MKCKKLTNTLLFLYLFFLIFTLNLLTFELTFLQIQNYIVMKTKLLIL